LLLPSLRWLYDYAWFVGFVVSASFYCLLMGKAPAGEKQAVPAGAAEL